MWKCTKCGRSFKKINQSHYCGRVPETVEDYIAAQDEEIRSQLCAVREVLSRSLPDAAEKIAWSMPTYWKGCNIVHFAANKKHIGLYPGSEAVEAFREQLKDYKTSKGAIQLPNNKELPLSLVAEIARWSYEKNRKE